MMIIINKQNLVFIGILWKLVMKHCQVLQCKFLSEWWFNDYLYRYVVWSYLLSLYSMILDSIYIEIRNVISYCILAISTLSLHCNCKFLKEFLNCFPILCHWSYHILKLFWLLAQLFYVFVYLRPRFRYALCTTFASKIREI